MDFGAFFSGLLTGLREGVEAALIVAIILAYLVKTGNARYARQIWVGAGAAIVLSLAVGIGLFATVGGFEEPYEQIFEGITMLVAAAVVTWMLFWMRRQGRHLKGELEQGIDQALIGGSLLGLAGVAFVSVAREGLETVLFLSVVFSAAAPGPEPAIGAVLGLAVAVGIGIAIFAFGVRVDLRRFFQVTAVILIFVAAGLCAYAVHEFGEAGVIANSGTVFDISDVLPESSPLGAVLAGLFGYRSAPTPLEVVAYFAYLIPVVTIYLVTDRPRQAPRPATA